MVAVEHGLKADLLSGMRGHAAHAGDQARLYAALDLVVRLVVADGGDQLIPLVLVRITPVLGLPEHVRGVLILAFVDGGGRSAVGESGGDGQALAAVNV